MRTERTLLALILAVTVAAVTVSAQDANKPESKEAKKDASKDAKKPAPSIAFVGGDVHTVTRGVIRNGTVVVENGKITRVGQDIEVPEGATRIDVSGKVITPGLVAINATNVGIRAGGGGPGGGPPGAGGATGKVTDNLNPFDRNILFCLGSGITTACVEVGAGPGGRFGRNGEVPEDLLELIDLVANDGTQLCPCCGLAILPTEPIGPAPQAERTARRHAVLKMSYGDMGPMLVKETPFYHLPAGSLTGALNRHQWRDQIKRAKQQLKNPPAGDDGMGFDAGGAPGARRVPDEVLKLVEKKIPLRTDAFSAEQMRDMIALARELDYDLVLDGVHEGWLVAGELGAAKVQTVLTPRSRRRAAPGKEDASGSSIETSGVLEKAGVPFAVAPLGASVSLDGLPGRDLTSLALEAAFAVRGGASEQTALAAVTIVPAKMLGLGDRIGSIEEGKDADLLILDGAPLDYRTYVQQAYVGGKLYYDRVREKIYPDAQKK